MLFITRKYLKPEYAGQSVEGEIVTISCILSQREMLWLQHRATGNSSWSRLRALEPRARVVPNLHRSFQTHIALAQQNGRATRDLTSLGTGMTWRCRRLLKTRPFNSSGKLNVSLRAAGLLYATNGPLIGVFWGNTERLNKHLKSTYCMLG